nr:1-acyl-sn-glycerol-3-phosphate acyltransferase [Clostridia bacterium]
ICVRRALRGYDPKVLVWDKNINGENGKMIRGVGGIPLPVNDLKAVSQCFKVIREDVSNGGWIHIYAEGSMWEFYQPIRPFKKGASYFAVKCNKPLVPLAFSYRKNGFIRSKIFKSPASLTLSIGEPLLPNLDLPEKERIEDLTRRSHDAVCILAGINPKENIYPEIFNNNERVDYYTTEYGIGYKGSW